MPPIANRLRTVTPETPLQPVAPHPLPQRPPLPGDSPLYSTTLRCPIPPLSTAASDNLRQFYVGGAVPQFRFNPPSRLT